MPSNRKSLHPQSSFTGTAALWRANESSSKRQGVLFKKVKTWFTRTNPNPEPRLEHQNARLLSLCATPMPLVENGTEEER